MYQTSNRVHKSLPLKRSRVRERGGIKNLWTTGEKPENKTKRKRLSKPTKAALRYNTHKNKVRAMKENILKKFKARQHDYDTLLVPALRKISHENLYNWFVNNKSITTIYKLECDKWNTEMLIDRINLFILGHLIMFYSRTTYKGSGLSALNFNNFKILFTPQLIASVGAISLAGAGINNNRHVLSKGQVYTKSTALTLGSLYALYLLCKHKRNTITSLADLFVKNNIKYYNE